MDVYQHGYSWRNDGGWDLEEGRMITPKVGTTLDLQFIRASMYYANIWKVFSSPLKRKDRLVILKVVCAPKHRASCVGDTTIWLPPSLLLLLA